jgi:hypothetical protein
MLISFSIYSSAYLGNYMDHLKGPKAKSAGHSNAKELVLEKQQAYWSDKSTV